MTEAAQHQGYPEVDQRKHNDQLDAIMGLCKQTYDRQIQFEEKLSAHILTEAGDIGKAIQDAINSAFPDGDAERHRMYHDKLIKAAERKEQFWNKLLFELSKSGLMVFLVWACYALWGAFKSEVHK